MAKIAAAKGAVAGDYVLNITCEKADLPATPTVKDLLQVGRQCINIEDGNQNAKGDATAMKASIDSASAAALAMPV